MYSVTELSKILKVSRTTIYNKLEHQDIKDFTKETDKGLRLQKEGLGVLQVLLANSKVNSKENSIETTSNDTYIYRYLELLEQQVKELRQDKQCLQDKYNILVDNMINQQQLLIGDREKKQISSWWKRIFSS